MGKSIFSPSCKKTKYYKVQKVNFDQVLNVGTAHLKSKHHLLIIWSIKNYPTEEQIPGSPYPIKVELTVFKKHKHCGSLKSMSGEFVFQLNSGTLPDLNSMGLPNGEYKFLVRSNNKDFSRKAELCMHDNYYELILH
jgi:hypothetical protein